MIILFSANTPHKAKCCGWVYVLQLFHLSQLYLNNLQWVDMETCLLKLESIKSPPPTTFSLSNETTGLYICLGKKILQDVPGWIIPICSLIRNVAPALPAEPSLGWCHGNSPSMNWRCSWDFIDGVWCLYFLLSVWCSCIKCSHDQYGSQPSQEHGLQSLWLL